MPPAPLQTASLSLCAPEAPLVILTEPPPQRQPCPPPSAPAHQSCRRTAASQRAEEGAWGPPASQRSRVARDWLSPSSFTKRPQLFFPAPYFKPSVRLFPPSFPNPRPQPRVNVAKSTGAVPRPVTRREEAAHKSPRTSTLTDADTRVTLPPAPSWPVPPGPSGARLSAAFAQTGLRDLS